MQQLVVANTGMGKNNIFSSVNPPAAGQVGRGAVAVAAGLFSHFFGRGKNESFSTGASALGASLCRAQALPAGAGR